MPGSAPAPAPRPPRLRPVPALSRGVAVLRLVAQAEEPLGVQAIARALGLVPSTCLHILRVLAEEQLLHVDPHSRKYVVGPGLAALARTALRRHGFAAAVQPDLEELAQRHGATALGVEASGLDHMTVVALARAPSPLQLHTEIGSRFPALISATGRCVAAFGGAGWAEIRGRFAALRWDSPPSLATWRSEVEATRAQGYAVDDGQYIRGVLVVAAPVVAANGVMGAIVLVGLRERMVDIGPAGLGEDLRARGHRLTAMLGGRIAGHPPA